MSQSTFGRHDLDDGLAAQVLVEELRHNDGNGQVLDALDYVAWNSDQAQNLPHVALEDGLAHAQSYIRPHIEKGPTKFLNRNRVHIPTYRQWCEPRTPRLVVPPHRVKQLVQIFLFEPSVVINIVQIPNI